MRQYTLREYFQTTLRSSQFCYYCGSLINRGEQSIMKKTVDKCLCLPCLAMSKEEEQRFAKDYLSQVTDQLLAKELGHGLLRLELRVENYHPVKLWRIECLRCNSTASFKTQNNVLGGQVFRNPQLAMVVLFTAAIGSLLNQTCLPAIRRH